MLARLILILALLLGPCANAQISLTGAGAGGSVISGGTTYIGPGDVVSGATAWYGLRGYNAAFATGSKAAINVRRASDNTTSDINILTNGKLDVATAVTFAGTDATATCTLASTTATCASASSTPHVGSTVVGASLTQPCLITAVGTFTGGAGTFTTSLAGTSTSCGAIGSGETFTMTYGLFVTEAYDQSGNGHHATQATAGSQPQLLPIGPNGTLPIIYTLSSSSQRLLAIITSAAQPVTFEAVSERVANFSSFQDFAGTYTGSGIAVQYNNTANKVDIYAGAPSAAVAATDSVLHAFQGIVSGSSSIIVVDGSNTTVNPSTGATGTSLFFCSDASNPVTGYCGEGGLWGSAFNSTQYGNTHTNLSSYWGTP